MSNLPQVSPLENSLLVLGNLVGGINGVGCNMG